MGKTSAKEAWEELAKIHEMKNKWLLDGPHSSNKGSELRRFFEGTIPGQTKRIERTRCNEFLKAILNKNWDTLMKLLEECQLVGKNPQILGTNSILHIAVQLNDVECVMKIVQIMSEEEILSRDGIDWTVLAYATYSEATDIAECLITKNNNLLTIPDTEGMIPVTRACVQRSKETTLYLYSRTQEFLDPEKGKHGSLLLHFCILNEMLGQSGVQTRTEEGLLVWCSYIWRRLWESELKAPLLLLSWLKLGQLEVETRLNLLDELAAMQQQFGVFQLVLAQLLARNNPGDPLVNLLNPAPPQPPAPPQNLEPVQQAPAVSESQGQSHIAPAQQPFHDDVTRRLDSLEKLVLETYDGTNDLDDHLHAFYSCMRAQNASDALMCKIFPSTLRGNARTWYYSLPPRSINSYTKMASAFATKFSSIRLIRKTTSELMRVKQRDGESLKNFMSRFNDAVLEVNSFDQAVGITAVILGLSHERFRDSFLKHPANTFNEIKNKMDLRRPGPMRTAATTRDHTRYCDFNQDHGHTTEQCNSLRSELESLAQKGMLNEYIQRVEQPRFVREQGPQPQGVRNPPNRQGVGYQQTPPPLPPPARIIHMITGGLEAGGLNSKQRKLYVREIKHPNRAQKWKFDNADWKNQPITFTSADFDTVVIPHNDPLVTSVMINNCEVQRVLVDTGSAPDIMYFHCFESLGLDPTLLQRYDGPIYGFNNQPVPVEGVLTMNVAFGSGQSYVTPSVRFLVVKMTSSFNVVIGRPTLTKIRAVKGKAQTPEINPKRVPDDRQVMGVEIVDNRPKDETRAVPVEDVEEVIKEEVEKLLQAGFVRRVDYCEWVANSVLVKKANGKWRMCIDYTNLNDACPKDCSPMPNIDKLVEAASGNERLSLLDAYSGYHQVPMALEDEEKTSFYAGDEIYCYVMMPFGLKNAGATYQKMVTIVFRAQISRNLEVYVDDIVVKSLKAEDHLTDLEETFKNLRKNRMRLNPAKCIFGVESGKFLGFMVSRRGIEVNPEKIKAVAEMEPPKSVKDIQRLIGRVAALHRFISKSADKCLPFFKIMRSAAQKDESGPYHSTPNPEPNEWTLYVDGASSSKGSGAGALLIDPDGYRSEHALKFNFDATNNMAEYEALLLGLQLALELKISAIQVYSDSQLVVNQIKSLCEVVDPVMMKYVALVAELKCRFQRFCLSKIPRAENEQVDSLSKFASNSSLNSRSVFVEVLDAPSFTKLRVMEISTDPSTPSWTDSTVSFLRDGVIPEEKQEAMKLRKKASRYILVDGVLYKRSFSLPLIRCLNPYEAKYALREVHEGVCGSHVGARTLAHKGYYWPNMYKDATQFVQRCQKCPFVKGVGGVTHLIVSVDYFTKWVEARALSSLTSKKVKDFVFSSIICRYGIPNQIVTDNGTQFNCSSFRDFCSSYGIKLQFTSVYHPESNGMVEFVNKCMLEGIKPRLEQHKAKWADELNNVLWAYRTTSRTTTGETPYHLAFGTEAVIPIEIGVPSFKVTHFNEGRNGQLLRENLDLLDEVREEARLRTLVYKQKVANFYNKRVRPRPFKVSDLVLRKAGLTGFETRFGKLVPNWEGPYTVAEVPHPGAYILQDTEGKRVPRVWNANNLKKFYP
ncbi:hypothetical protein SLEP1_g44174 [Rubroshorea leprosula]|uniref:Uncharacterized protein n=1 Tax=Rubroshorea leprosula TaxID=152421 RepID=A0AAV5LFU8_9ROSI|nr:hypothetical protein SLEP1_g44174 [Rubroshorea leprosula]